MGTFQVAGKPYTFKFSEYTISSGSTCLLALMGIDVPAPNGPPGSSAMASCASTTPSLIGATSVLASPSPSKRPTHPQHNKPSWHNYTGETTPKPTMLIAYYAEASRAISKKK